MNDEVDEEVDAVKDFKAGLKQGRKTSGERETWSRCSVILDGNGGDEMDM